MEERILKYFNDELNQSESLNLLRDIENDETLKKEFAIYRNMRGLISLKQYPADTTEGKKKFSHFMDSKKAGPKQKLSLQIMKYAAAIAVVFTATWMAAYFYYNDDEITYNTISTPAGQYASLTLSDGTEVWMNARSSIKYPSHFNGKERKVEVDGEAYFKVARNEKFPFLVSTSTLDIKVLGTTFNIKSYKGSPIAEVSLLEGAVKVFPAQDATKEIRLKPMQTLTLEDKKARISQLHDENAFLWKQGILFFDNLPLADIARRIEWHYDTQIIIQNPNIGKFLYTGKFRQQDGPHEILRILQKTYKFTFEKDDVNNIFLIK